MFIPKHYIIWYLHAKFQQTPYYDEAAPRISMCDDGVFEVTPGLKYWEITFTKHWSK